MAGRLDGKIAVVTGGGNGIGRACCHRFADEGADVVVADVIDEAAEQTAAAVKDRGREALAVHLDASSPEDNQGMVDRALERFGKVDVLVTAAGISHAAYRSGDFDADRELIQGAIERFGQPGAGLEDMTPDEWRKVIDVNLTGTMLAVRAAATPMIQARSGAIVTIASIAAKRPEAGPYAYGASKAGVWMFTKTAARDLAPAGIRVNSIGPGYIDTNMTHFVGELPGIKDLLMLQIPMGRVGKPEEVASVALFLASDDASYVTGELIHPDGGFYTD